MSLVGRKERTRIWVYSWAVPDSSGGFQWVPVDRDPGGAEALKGAVSWDQTSGYGVLAEIHVAGYAPDGAGRQRVTDLIEGELQDAIALGLVGRVIYKYDNERSAH